MAKAKKSSIVLTIISSVLLVLTIIASILLNGPYSTVMNMYFGKGQAIISEASKNVSTEYYKSDYDSAAELSTAGKALAQEVGAEGIVLLKNEGNALPLTSSEKNISLFGRTSVDPIYTGAGSGAAENNPVNYKTAFTENGFKINDDLYNFYTNHPISTEVHSFTMMSGIGPIPVKYTGRGFVSAYGSAQFINDIIAEVPAKDFPSSLTASYKTNGDAAVVIIGRVGGEGCDLPINMAEFATTAEDKSKHYLELDSREISLLKYVKAQKDAGLFKKIIVICNTANAMEMGFINDAQYGIDAAVWVGCLGDTGSRGVAEILAGSKNPSGRLVDTYVSDLEKDPSHANFVNTYYTNVASQKGTGSFNEYEEGIYVGYRYYETAAAEAMAGNYSGFNYDKAVVYPFGYGLSYSKFDMEFDGTPKYSNDTFTFNVKVTNKSNVAGKQVVELYTEAPYTKGGIEKAKVVLTAFAKTSLLQPNQSETVKLTVKAEDLASYDYKNHKCYVLDAGEYKFYLSENAHSWTSISTSDAKHYYAKNLKEVVYSGDNRRDSDAVTATNVFDDVSSVIKTYMSRADFAGTFPKAPEGSELVASDKIKAALEFVYDAKAAKTNEGTAPTMGAKNGLSLIDLRGVAYEDPLWDQLLDQIDLKEALPMLANAGYNTAEMLSVGKPATLDYDGPMGWSTWVSANGETAICTGFPAEEIIAASWNTELAYRIGRMVGNQGLNNGFNGWYAPAMNTHRNAFAGRNYEYYSEDGLLAGKIAAQEVSGAMDLGTYSYLKHFALNDKEDGRNGLAVFANEQAIREIYLRPYEVCIKEAKANVSYNDADGNLVSTELPAATAIMSSYNRVGTKWSGATPGLMTQILRNEWGFRGMVLTDYFGGDPYMNADEGILAGNDCMLNTFADGSLKDSSSPAALNAIRRSVHNILYAVANSNAMQGIASGSSIKYAMAGWQKLIVLADVIFGLFFAGSACYFLLSKKKSE